MTEAAAYQHHRRRPLVASRGCPLRPNRRCRPGGQRHRSPTWLCPRLHQRPATPAPGRRAGARRLLRVVSETA